MATGKPSRAIVVHLAIQTVPAESPGTIGFVLSGDDGRSACDGRARPSLDECSSHNVCQLGESKLSHPYRCAGWTQYRQLDPDYGRGLAGLALVGFRFGARHHGITNALQFGPYPTDSACPTDGAAIKPATPGGMQGAACPELNGTRLPARTARRGGGVSQTFSGEDSPGWQRPPSVRCV
jgi:hypothetical protein